MLRCGAFMYNSVSRKQNQNTKWIHSTGKMWNVYRKQYWLKRKKSKESDCRLDCIHPALLYFIYSMGRIFLLLLLRLPLMKYGKAIGFFKIDTFISVQSLSHIGSLRPHGLQHARPPCPSLTLGVYLNSHPLGWWCHPTISFSVIPFSSCLQSFPASESFQMS